MCISQRVYAAGSWIRPNFSRVGDGDESAWNELVDQFAGLVWSVARSFRLGKAATDDVVQTVWLRLAEHSSRIRQPDRLASWLATTTQERVAAGHPPELSFLEGRRALRDQ